MKTALFYGKEDVRVEEVPTPEPKEGEVQVKVKACGICGSEQGLWTLEGKKEGIKGHESAGIITKLGGGVTKVKEGDRIVVYDVVGCGICNYCLEGKYTYCRQRKGGIGGGYGEYLVCPEKNALPLPNDISFERGCLLSDCLGTPAKAVRKVGVKEEDRVVVFGCGPIGLNAIQVCKGYGAWVMAVDFEDYRLESAKKLGADYTINGKNTNVKEAIYDRTKIGADKIIECTGSPVAQKSAIESVKANGRVVFVGEHGKFEISPSEHLIRRDVEIMGSWYIHVSDYYENLELIRTTMVDPFKIVTHIVPLEKIGYGFDVFCNKKENCLKVVVKMEDR